MCRVEVVGAQRTQLLASQRAVVSERQHQPVADRFVTKDRQHVAPLLIGGDPWHLDEPRHQRTSAGTNRAPGAVTAPADRVRAANTLLDQKVIEEPHRDKALLERGVREAAPRVKRHRIHTKTARTARQLPDERRDLRPASDKRIDTVALADLQILSKPARIRVDRPRCPTKIGPDPQPLDRTLVAAEDHPLLL